MPLWISSRQSISSCNLLYMKKLIILVSLILFGFQPFLLAFAPRPVPSPPGVPENFKNGIYVAGVDGSYAIVINENDKAVRVAYGGSDREFIREVSIPMRQLDALEFVTGTQQTLVGDNLYLVVSITVREEGVNPRYLEQHFFSINLVTNTVNWQQSGFEGEQRIISLAGHGHFLAYTQDIGKSDVYFGNVYLRGEVKLLNRANGAVLRSFSPKETEARSFVIFGENLHFSDQALLIQHSNSPSTLPNFAFHHRYVDLLDPNQEYFFRYPYNFFQETTGLAKTMSLDDETVYFWNGRAVQSLQPKNGLTSSSYGNIDLLPGTNSTTATFGAWVLVEQRNTLELISLKDGSIFYSYPHQYESWLLGHPNSRSNQYFIWGSKNYPHATPEYFSPNDDAPLLKLASVRGSAAEGLLQLIFNADEAASQDHLIAFHTMADTANPELDYHRIDHQEYRLKSGQTQLIVDVPLHSNDRIEPSKHFWIRPKESSSCHFVKDSWLIEIPKTSLIPLNPRIDNLGKTFPVAAGLYEAAAGTRYELEVEIGAIDSHLQVHDMITGELHWEIPLRIRPQNSRPPYIRQEDFIISSLFDVDEIEGTDEGDWGLRIYSLSQRKQVYHFKNPRTFEDEPAPYGRSVWTNGNYIAVNFVRPTYGWDVYNLKNGQLIFSTSNEDNIYRGVSLVNDIFIWHDNISDELKIVNLDQPDQIVTAPSLLQFALPNQNQPSKIGASSDYLYLQNQNTSHFAKYHRQTGEVVELPGLPESFRSGTIIGAFDDEIIFSHIFRKGIRSNWVSFFKPDDLSEIAFYELPALPDQVTRSSESYAFTLEGQPVATVDRQPDFPTFLMSPQTLHESTRSHSLHVTTSQALPEELIVTVELEGSGAETGLDFPPTKIESPNTITLSAGTRFLKIPLTIFDDFAVEGAETAKVILRAGERVLLCEDITILSDDLPIQYLGNDSLPWNNNNGERVLASDVSLRQEEAMLAQPLYSEGSITTGRVLVYDLNNKNIKHILKSPLPRDLALFGASVTITNDYYIVGEPGNPGGFQQGFVYLFDRETGSYLRRFTEGPSHKAFGSYLASNSTHLYVTDLGSSIQSVPGNLFRYSLDTFQKKQLHSPFAQSDDFYGEVIVAEDDLILIGVPELGRVDVFSAVSGDFSQSLQVNLEETLRPSNFGNTIGVLGNEIYIGARGFLFCYDRSSLERLWRMPLSIGTSSGTDHEILTGENFIIVATARQGSNSQSYFDFFDRFGNLFHSIPSDLYDISAGSFIDFNEIRLLRQGAAGDEHPFYANYEWHRPESYLAWHERMVLGDELTGAAEQADSYQSYLAFLQKDGGKMMAREEEGFAWKIEVPNSIPPEMEVTIETSSDLSSWKTVGMLDARGKVILTADYFHINDTIRANIPLQKAYLRFLVRRKE